MADVGAPSLPLEPVAAVSNARAIFRDWVSGYPDGEAGYGSRGVSWLGEDELLFGSETSGYVHAVAARSSGDVEAGTASVRDLTPLPCDCQQWSAHEGALYVVHNCDTVDSLGVAKVDIKLGAPSHQPILVASNHSVCETRAPLPNS